MAEVVIIGAQMRQLTLEKGRIHVGQEERNKGGL